MSKSTCTPESKSIHATMINNMIKTNVNVKTKKIKLVRLVRKDEHVAYCDITHRVDMQPIRWILTFKQAPILKDMEPGLYNTTIDVRAVATPLTHDRRR